MAIVGNVRSCRSFGQSWIRPWVRRNLVTHMWLTGSRCGWGAPCGTRELAADRRLQQPVDGGLGPEADPGRGVEVGVGRLVTTAGWCR